MTAKPRFIISVALQHFVALQNGIPAVQRKCFVMTSLSHVQNRATVGAPASAQILTVIVGGIALLAAGVLLTTPISQVSAPVILALIAAATVWASRPATDRCTIATAMIAVVAIIAVQLAPSVEFGVLAQMLVGTILGALSVTSARRIFAHA